jgi:hypothetical protein
MFHPDADWEHQQAHLFHLSAFTLFLNEDNVGEFLINMSRLFQSETVDGINELADVLSLHLGGT